MKFFFSFLFSSLVIGATQGFTPGGAFYRTNGAGNSFLTSGTTYTTPANINSNTQFKFTLIGGGGAGGGGGGGVETPGGGAGATCIVYLTGLAPSTAYTYAIGSGGTSPASGAGNAGTDTTLMVNSITYTAGHGSGGANTLTTNGGAGGTCTNTTINISGQNGSAVSSGAGALSGLGGSSAFGLGGAMLVTGSGGAGLNGTGYGSGGGGLKTGVSPGGNGAAGAILVEWIN